jgi:hypothetical protein
MSGPRIALIHALRHSPPPIEAAFAADWPEAAPFHLMDTSLSADLAAVGAITPAITARFLALGRYAADAGAAAILFTCSAFGPCIATVKAALAPLPVLAPTEAMVTEAVAACGPVGLIATFPNTLATLPDEFPAGTELRTALADGALAALDAGDTDLHDRLVYAAALNLPECRTIALAQFSMARAAQAVRAATGKRVLTTQGSALALLKQLVDAKQPADRDLPAVTA